MRLNATAVWVLETELPSNEVETIQLMVKGKALPERVTRNILTNIIIVLCKLLDWVEDEAPSEPTDPLKSSDYTENAESIKTEPSTLDIKGDISDVKNESKESNDIGGSPVKLEYDSSMFCDGDAEAEVGEGGVEDCIVEIGVKVEAKVVVMMVEVVFSPPSPTEAEQSE